MDILKGIVSNSRHSTAVNSTSRYVKNKGYQTNVYTNQVAIFDVGDRPVEFRFSESIMVSDGDLVVVVGYTYGGLLKGLGYKNLTKQVMRRKNIPITGNFIAGAISIFFGLLLLFIGIGIILIGIGAYNIYVGINNQKLANEADRLLYTYN